VTYTFPENSGTGFSVSLSSLNFATSINVWGAQFEIAAQPGPYIATTGVAQPTGGQGGSTSFTYDNFLTGTHSITAQYAGDIDFIGSTSNTVVLSGAQEVPGMIFSSSSSGPIVYGAAVTLAVQLSDQDNSNDWVPSGTVQFFDGTTSLGTATVNSSGVASITLSGVSALTGGTHTLTAKYSGDSTFTALTSSPITQVVSKVSSNSVIKTTVSSSANPAIYGTTITMTVKLTSSLAAIPTGTVTLMDGNNTVGTLTLNSSGSASIQLQALIVGTNNLVFSYSGDSNYD